MPITRPIPALESDLTEARTLADRGGLPGSYSMFFDDVPAVMYRKIDTTLLSVRFLTVQTGTVEATGVLPGSSGISTASDNGRVL